MTAVARAGILSSAVLAVIGIAAVVGGLGYGVVQEDGLIGPGFLPTMAGGLVAVFAIGDVIGRLRPRTTISQTELILGADAQETLAEEAAAESDIDIFGRDQKQRTRMLVVVMGILIATLLLVQVLGFLISFALMLIAIAVFVEKRRWVPALVVTAAAIAVTYALFVVLLRVPLPQGLIGII
jgi:putative tricarboxylic transport membrane protein